MSKSSWFWIRNRRRRSWWRGGRKRRISPLGRTHHLESLERRQLLSVSSLVEEQATESLIIGGAPAGRDVTPPGPLPASNNANRWSDRGVDRADAHWARRFGVVPSAHGVRHVQVNQGAAASAIDLASVFNRSVGGPLDYQLVLNTNPDLFGSVQVDQQRLRLAYAADQSGLASLTVRAANSEGEFAIASFSVLVVPENGSSGLRRPFAVDVSEDTRGTEFNLRQTFRHLQRAKGPLTYEIVEVAQSHLFQSVRINQAREVLVLDPGHDQIGLPLEFVQQLRLARCRRAALAPATQVQRAGALGYALRCVAQ